jgi:hypothetical protein
VPGDESRTIHADNWPRRLWRLCGFFGIAVALLWVACDGGSKGRSKNHIMQPADTGILQVKVVFSQLTASERPASLIDSGIVVIEDSTASLVAAGRLEIIDSNYRGVIEGIPPGSLTATVGFFQGDTLRWVGSESVLIRPGETSALELETRKTDLTLGGETQTSPGFPISLTWSGHPDAEAYHVEQSVNGASSAEVYAGGDTTVVVSPDSSVVYKVRIQHPLGSGIWSSGHRIEVSEPRMVGLAPSLMLSGVDTVIVIRNEGSGLLTWELTEIPNWILIDTRSDTLSAGSASEIQLQLAPDLAASSYTGSLRFLSNIGEFTTSIAAEVVGTPAIEVSDTLTVSGSSTVEQLVVRNPGTGELSVVLRPDREWITVDPSGQIAVMPGGEVIFNVRVGKNCLAAGLREGGIELESELGISEIVVVAEIPNEPKLTISDEQHRIELSSDTDEATLILQNGGFGLLEWEIESDALGQWLTASPVRGTTLCELDSIALSFDDAGMRAGQVYLDTLTVAGTGGEISVLLELRIEERHRLATPLVDLDFGLVADTLLLVLHNRGSLDTEWSVDSLPQWIVATPEQGTVPFGDSTTVQIAVQRDAIEGVVAEGVLSLSYDTETIQVNLLAARPKPSGELGATFLEFGANADTLLTTVRNTGLGPLIWEEPDLPEWLSLVSAPVSLLPDSAQNLVFVADRSLLTELHQEASIAISSNAVSPIDLLVISIDALYALGRISLTEVEISQRDSIAHVLITSEGTVDLVWAVEELPSWILVSPDTGKVPPGSTQMITVRGDWELFDAGERREGVVALRGNASEGIEGFTVRGSANSPPTSVAVFVGEVTLDEEGFLSGVGSSDPDGDMLTYRWSSLHEDEIVHQDSSRTGVLFSDPGAHSFVLTVSDGLEEDSDTVTTILNSPPIANAGLNKRVEYGQQVVLSGSGIDPEGDELTFRWHSLSGIQLEDTSTESPQFTAWRVDSLYFALTVSDGEYTSSPDTTIVMVERSESNSLPVAIAPDTIHAEVGQRVSISGEASVDSDRGAPLSYTWRQLGGPEVEINDDKTPVMWIVSASAADYSFELTVDDGQDRSVPDTTFVLIRGQDRPPVARAGVDQSSTVGDVVRLDGNGSSDPDGDSLTYVWRQLSGFIVEVVTGGNGAGTFTVSEAGVYQFELTVSDGRGGASADTVKVTVEASNSAPTANAGTDQSAKAGDVIRLDGSGSSDPDGDSLTHAWRQLSGFIVEVVIGVNGAGTFAVSEASVYQFELTVSDGRGGASTDTVIVTVSESNTAPTASAGVDQAVAVGSVVTLDGRGSTDADGDALNYEWTQDSGPIAMLTSSSGGLISFTASESGSYFFTITVSDGSLSSSDTVIIQVTEVTQDPDAITLLEVEPNNNQSSANSITFGSPFTGRIATSSDKDYFLVPVSSDGLLTVDLRTDGNTGFNDYFVVTILDLSGNTLDERQASTGETVQVQAQVSSGTYYVRIADYLTSDERYTCTVTFTAGSSGTVEVEPNNNQSSANSITFGSPFTGRIATSSDKDYFLVPVSSDGLLTVDLRTDGNTGFNDYFVVTILDLSGNTLDERRASTGESVQVQAQVSSGTYYVRIADYLTSDERYTCTVSLN